MRDDATTDAVLVHLKRLAQTFGKPFGLKAHEQGEEYAKAFRRCGIPMAAVGPAVDEQIALGKRFPPPSELIERAREFLPQTDGERQGRDPNRCPSCGSHYFYAGYELTPYAPRGLARDSRGTCVVARVRCACPQSDEGWWTQAALDWTETDASHHDRLMPGDYGKNPRYRVALAQPQHRRRGAGGWHHVVAAAPNEDT